MNDTHRLADRNIWVVGECGADAARRADDPDVPAGEAVLVVHLRLLPVSHGVGG